jgi:hypothetical protein
MSTNLVTTNTNTNVVVVNSPGPAGQRGERGIQGVAGTINSNSGLVITGSSIFSGSVDGAAPTISVIGSTVITGSLIVSSSNTFINIGAAKFTGSVSVSGSLAAASFSGSGAQLTNIPASGITGLNLSQISTGSVSASVGVGSTIFDISSGGSSKLSINSSGQLTVPGNTLLNGTLNVNGSSILSSTTISGVTTLVGTATLNGQPITTAGDLTLDKIKAGTVTASVSSVGDVFTILNASTAYLKVESSGVTSGSFKGSGAGLTNIPASGIVGLNLTQIGDSQVTASVSSTSTPFAITSASVNLLTVNNASKVTATTFSGSLIGQSNTTGSLTGSFDGNASGLFSGTFVGNGAQLTNLPASSIVGLNLSQVATGSISASVALSETFFNVTSGSNTYLSVSSSRVTIGSGSLYVSRSVNAYNINTGVPTSNQWQSNLNGSYFNNFTSQTDVSEVLRFIAGLLSSSAPDAAPNTKTLGSITQVYANNGTGTVTSGYVPQSSTNADILYLISKGFAAAGGTLFSGIGSIYNNSNYSISYSSVFGGTTSVSSSNDTQLFGLGPLTSGGPTQVNVSGSINWFYSDSSAQTATATSQSQNLISNNSFSTTNGITLAKINTANTAVIPPAYQDGKFATIFSSVLYNNSRSFSSVSSSGYYHITASVIISSGSSPYSSGSVKTAQDKIFFAPLSTISTNVGTNTLAIGYSGYRYLTATSRSLSGAPYLTAATYEVSSSITGLFNPLYGSSATLARQTTTGNVTISNGGGGAFAASITSGLINTANTVYDSTGVTARATSTVPLLTDIVELTGSISLSIGTGTNIVQTSSVSPSTYTVVTNGTNKNGSESTLNTLTIPYHTAGTFGQLVSSGSMGYFGGGSTNTTLIEYFTSESYRRQISNSTSLSTQWDQIPRLTLGDSGPLQVKPGFLVNPESSNGYWYPTAGYSATNFKWYLREFDTAVVSNKGTLTISLLPGTSADLVDFQTSTTGKIAIGVIFQYQVDNKGAGRVVMFDAVKGNGSYGGALNNQATSAQYNPFSDNIDIVANFSGFTNSSGTLTLSLNNGINQTINAAGPKIWLAVRYCGTPSNALQRITIS